jgi:hypothetical protein
MTVLSTCLLFLIVRERGDGNDVALAIVGDGQLVALRGKGAVENIIVSRGWTRHFLELRVYMEEKLARRLGWERRWRIDL